MNKPQDWDKTEAFTGEFKNITPGGHICKIVDAYESTTQSGKAQLIIEFDIAAGEFKDFYKEQHERRLTANAEAKWQGIYRQLTGGEIGQTNPYFKGVITAIEESNKGYKWNWDEKTLVGKLFGGVFGQEEYETDKGIKLATKCFWIRSVEAVKKGIEPPAIKRLQVGNVFADKPKFPEEEIPF
jgi:hypothetical protein